MIKLTKSERTRRFEILSTMRCCCCGAFDGIQIHHEPAGHGSRNDRRAVPLCYRCHETRHRPAPSQTRLAEMIRRTCEERAIEIDAVFAVEKIIG